MPVRTSKDRPILLLGAYGRGNIGDDAFTLCATELFKGRTIYINAAHNLLLPQEAVGKVRTISTDSIKDIIAKLHLLLSVKEIIYWGGDLWVKLYGTKRPRRLLYKMLAINLLMRLTGKKVHYIGCGIGPLAGFSLWLARLSAGLAETIVVREQRSADTLRIPSIKVLPDLTINLPYNKPLLHKLPNGKPFVIVISVLWSIPDRKRNFPKLLNQISKLLDSLPSKDFSITLLPMQISSTEKFDDLWAAKQLEKQIKKHTVTIHTARDIEAAIKCLRECHLVIGTRLHANILAILNATPSIGIAYRPKVRSFFTDNQLNEYCLGLDNLEGLENLFKKVYSNYHTIAQLFHHASEYNLNQKTAYAELVKEL